MGERRKTICDLCPTGCGLDILIEDDRMVKVRGDKDNPRSEGYACRKGLNIHYHQHHAQRLTYPLKRLGDSFERISWEQAFEEIAGKVRAIIEKHGPRSLAYAGAAREYGTLLLGGLGSQNYYSSLAQELTGAFWVNGHTFGNQGLSATPDYQHTDMLLAIGWNGMMSHMMPQAPRFLKQFSKDPEKRLVVIDPRLSETARIADIHLPIRPGTDALLNRAMIAIILQEGWHNKNYIAQYVSGFDKILPWFSDFNARAAAEVCQLDYDQVRDVCHMFATRKSSLHSGLGIEMGRHSTATSYLEAILLAVCGRIGVSGGNVFHGGLMHAGPPPGKPDTHVWRTPATGFSPILGMLPPNIMPEEIMNDNPERLRAVIVCASNPLRSWADTTAYEKAFKQLELLVTVEIAMTETAALSHYVLPARSCFESWGGCLPVIDNNYPEIFFQMRQPIVKPAGETLETGEILVRLGDSLGLIHEIPDSLYKVAKGDRMKFGAELMAYAQSDPRVMRSLPFVLARTLGQAMGNVNLAALWWNLFTSPKHIIASVSRGGFKPGPDMVEELFQAIISHPEGLWVGRSDPENNLAAVCTRDRRINVFIPEMADWIKSINAEVESKALKPDKDYPFILMAGRHMDMNANTQMRDPAWNRGRRACTLAMNPNNAKSLNLIDGQIVKITTEAGSAEIELEVTDSARPAQVIIPHGFGLDYDGQVYGINVNRLTKNTHRDRIAGTPLHRFVPCRIEGP